MNTNITLNTTIKADKPNPKERILNLLFLSVPILMGIFVFFNPFPHTTSIKEICFYLSVFIVLILICFNKINFSFKSPLTLPFVLFTIWAFIGLFFAVNRENTFHDIYGHLLKYIILYYIFINFFNSKRLFYVLLWAIITSLGVITLSCMIYFYIVKAMPITARLGVPEFNVPVNSIGLIAAYSLLIELSMFEWKNKLYLKLVFLLLISTSSLAILLSRTIGAIIGLIFPIFILLPKNKKKMAVFILFFLILLSLLPTRHILSMINIRLQYKIRPAIWYSYFQAIKEQPVIGTGFGMEIYNPISLEKFNAHVHLPDKFKKLGPFHPHNILIDITVRTGIIGLILFLYIIVSSLWITIKTARKTENHFIKNWAICITAVFISILIQSMFTDMLLGKQAYLFYLTLPLMTILWRLDAEALS